MKKAIIIGASSGIGYELARVFSEEGYKVGVTARRTEPLLSLQATLPNQCYVQQMDVTQLEVARQQLLQLIDTMEGMDIIVLNAGVGWGRATLHQELTTIQTNVLGWVNLAYVAMEYFINQGHGHLVGISSVAALRGSSQLTAYSASKAFISNYLEGLRLRIARKKWNIAVTDIRPGYVATPMTAGNKGMFWIASPTKAAHQIYRAILARKKIAYITHRWALVAPIYRLIPDFLLK